MMDLKVQKRLASEVLGCSKGRVVFDSERLEEIKEAITKTDIRALIKDRAIVKLQKKGVSRARAKKQSIQKSKGRQRSHGSRKGSANARLSKKTAWMNKIRPQRVLLKELKDDGKITKKTYQNLYRKAKGGFFRSRRHINLFVEEHNLVVEDEKKK